MNDTYGRDLIKRFRSEEREPLRVWYYAPYKLTLWECGWDPFYGPSRQKLAYEFCHDGQAIFLGCDFTPSDVDAIDSNETLTALLHFLALGEGDVEDDYFIRNNYGSEQIAWRDEHAEDLGTIVVWMEGQGLNEERPYPWKENEDGSRIEQKAKGTRPDSKCICNSDYLGAYSITGRFCPVHDAG